MRYLLALLLAIPAFAGPQMCDPAIDDAGPFCYLSKSSTIIGMKDAHTGTQVTFDGAFYTGAAELAFFTGTPLRPICVRSKTFAEGYLPIVQYHWTEGDVTYSVEAFGMSLDGKPESNIINFIRVRVDNRNSGDQKATLAAAFRYCGGDHRSPDLVQFGFKPNWQYEMTPSSALRDHKLIYTFSALQRAASGTVSPSPRERPQVAERGPGGEVYLTERNPACFATYTIPPGSWQIDLRLPLHPVPVADAKAITAIPAASYDDYRARTVTFWKGELAQGGSIELPEAKVTDASRANLIYTLIAREKLSSPGKPDEYMQKVNDFQYRYFWLRDSAYIIRGYEVFGLHRVAEEDALYFLKFQKPDGEFTSQGGQLDGHGQALWTFGQHYELTHDLAFASRVYPTIPKAIAWLHQTRAADEYHLLPRTNAHDNEGIDGRYSGHNFWALGGVEKAIVLAKATGHLDDAARFQAEYDDYKAALMRRLADVCAKTGGYIPPGLDVPGGQNWGNFDGVYPGGVLAPDNPWVAATLAHARQETEQEGMLCYGGTLHHYMTIKGFQNDVFRVDQEQSVKDLYALLLHTGSTHEGFEFCVTPWADRDSGGNYPPHGCFAGHFNSFLRNLLVHEYKDELRLFPCLAPAWVKPGQRLALHDMPTAFGPVSAEMRCTATGAEVSLDARWYPPSPGERYAAEGQRRVGPRELRLYIPYFTHLRDALVDGKKAHVRDNYLILPANARNISLTWDRTDAPELSYAATVAAYRAEYRKRYASFIEQGGKPYDVSAPAFLEPDRAAWESRWSPAARGLAVGKPVTTNGGTEGDHAPELAVDGDADDKDDSGWFAGPPTPRWLQVDLQQPELLDHIQVFPYWDGGRSYQYYVEASLDGKTWTQIADARQNTKPATPAGDKYSFPPLEARYVRITMLHNTANPSIHLVELRVFRASGKGQ